MTGDECDPALSILASHPLTAERLETLKREFRDRPPLLSAQESDKVRGICGVENRGRIKNICVA
ncbi:MAG: hypothetical protein QOH98_220 [Methylobacteriaceae bacterium]|jgi:hypothetical protein|nr:hypothetical protein [Methylobacteriaceae bacterium]